MTNQPPDRSDAEAAAATATDWLPAAAPEHDTTGTTVARQIAESVAFEFPTLPRLYGTRANEISQRQFESFLLGVLGGLAFHLAAALVGIDRKVVTRWMQKGARGVANDTGDDDAYTLFYRKAHQAQACHLAWLTQNLLKHITTDKDVKALVYAMDAAGFGQTSPDLEADEAASEAVFEDLAKSMPRTQTPKAAT